MAAPAEEPHGDGLDSPRISVLPTHVGLRPNGDDPMFSAGTGGVIDIGPGGRGGMASCLGCHGEAPRGRLFVPLSR